MKRPNTALKQQRKDSPGLQHRGAGPGGRGQANVKAERPGLRDARGTKAKDDKVRPAQVEQRSTQLVLGVVVFIFSKTIQGKKGSGDGAGDAEQRKFDGTGYDGDLVESLERDIVSRNPNVHWYGGRARTTGCILSVLVS